MNMEIKSRINHNENQVRLVKNALGSVCDGLEARSNGKDEALANAISNLLLLAATLDRVGDDLEQLATEHARPIAA